MWNRVHEIKAQRAFLLLTIGVIVAYFFNVLRLTDNIPFADDYGHLLGFLNTAIDENISTEIKLKQLWSAHTIHRTVLARLTVLLEYKMFGIFNFKHVMFIGNLALVGVFFLLYRKLGIKELGYQHLLVVSLLLFIPMNTLSNWALCTFGYFFLMLLAISSFMFLDKGGWKNLIIAAIFAILSTLTYGAGLFVFLAGISMLVVKEEYKLPHIGVWILIFIAWSAFFLNGVHRPESYPPTGAMLFEAPLTVIGYFLASLGAFFKDIYANHQWMKFLFGAAMISYLLFLVVKYFDFFKKNPFIACLLIYIILVTAGSAMNRSHFGIQYGERDKFHFLPALFLSLIYIASIKIFKNKNKGIFLGVLISGFLLFLMKNDTQFSVMKNQQNRVNNQLANFVMNKDTENPKYSIPARRVRALERGVAKGTYDVNASFLMKPDQVKFDEADFSKFVIKDVIHQNEKNEVVDIKGWAFIEGKDMIESNIYICLEKDGFRHYYLTQNMNKRELTQRFWKDYKKDIDNAGFKILLPKPRLGLSSGEYRVGIVVEKEENNGTWARAFTMTNKKIQI